ncbi:MAG: hypothetical protein IPI11_02410 [Haliscomenobacter sp.]|nr:hypothetical protein [Haliscomenobacter sp.]
MPHFDKSNVSILPQTLYEDPAMQKLFTDGLSSAVYKKLAEPVIGKEGYVSTHALTMVLQGMLDRGGREG